MKTIHILLVIITTAMVIGCSGGGDKEAAPKRSPLKTAADLEKRLTELGLELYPESSSVKAMLTASGYRFQYEVAAGDANTRDDMIEYYNTEFIAKLRRQGWQEPPMSTALRRIVTHKGEMITISAATPGVTADAQVHNTFITHQWK